MTAFELPIPGQSLTTEPKAAPYERPPEFDNLQDVIKMHMDNLSRKEAIEDIVFFIKKGMDIKSLNEGILRSAVLEGQHSIDNSINVAPITHERIIGIANAAGLDFDEGFVDEEGERRLDESRVGTKILRRLREERPLEETVRETKAPTPPEPQEEMPMDEQSPDGLMTRRA